MIFKELADNITFGTKVHVTNLDNDNFSTEYVANMANDYPNKKHLENCFVESITVENGSLDVEVGEPD